jgi:hypothetical protein
VSPRPELIFWPGSLPGGFAAALVAADAGGFSNLAVSPLTIHQLLNSESDGAAIQTAAARYGVRLAQLDGATSWAPIRYAEHMAEPLKAGFDFSSMQILDLATVAGMDSILAAGAFDPGATAPTTSPAFSPLSATELPAAASGWSWSSCRSGVSGTWLLHGTSSRPPIGRTEHS